MEKTRVINLGPLEEFPVGQGAYFVIEGEEVAVFRARDGKVSAISNRCPHRGGSLADGIIGGGKVVCPLHGHKFDLATGQGCEGGESIRVFEAAVEHGDVLIKYPADFFKKALDKG